MGNFSKKIRCPNCKQLGGVMGKGRAFGNRGKREYECICGHSWQYGYGKIKGLF